MVVAVFKKVSSVTAAYSGILHVTKESSRHTLNDDTTESNMDTSMSSSGYSLFFVTLRPGFEPRENIQILTRGQGIEGATCANYLNSNKHLIKTHMLSFFIIMQSER